MNVDVVSIAKKERSLYDPLNKELIKMSSRFAKINDIELFNKDVTKAHTISPEAAQSAYTKLLESHLAGAYTVALHPD